MFAVIFFIIAATLFRLVFPILGTAHAGWLANFSPLAAVALCGAMLLPKRAAIAIPLATLLISNLILNAHYREPLFSGEMLFTYAAFGLILALGFALRKNPRLPVALGGSVLSSLIFYVVTNSGCWLADSGYAKTFTGWLQALTTGLPGYDPTWMFFRNSAASDLLFTALFFGCFALARKWSFAKTANRHLATEPTDLKHSQF